MVWGLLSIAVASCMSADLCGVFNQINHIKSCNEIKIENNQTRIIVNVKNAPDFVIVESLDR